MLQSQIHLITVSVSLTRCLSISWVLYYFKYYECHSSMNLIIFSKNVHCVYVWVLSGVVSKFGDLRHLSKASFVTLQNIFVNRLKVYSFVGSWQMFWKFGFCENKNCVRLIRTRWQILHVLTVIILKYCTSYDLCSY